ncbi:MAG TPA: L-threonine 3-dehydrogenase [Chloroflexi bacterium]|nr:L-threonine 3-dehydrogenase [Chloroflexota bacterium]
MAEMMRAAVFKGNGRLEIEERPVPTITAPDDVLLAVEGCGVCGSDLHILEIPPTHPANENIILGHEYIGRVVAVGPGVKRLQPGDRVTVAPNLACGVCRYCRRGMPNQCEDFTTLGIFRDGGLAAYNVAPERALYPVSDRVPFEEIIFTEVLSCVVAGTEQVRVQPGESVAILGAGPVGLLFHLVFQAAGASPILISDVAPARLTMAERLGARSINAAKEDVPAAVRAATGGWGADVVVDAVGLLLPQAVAVARKGGTVLLFGMNSAARPSVSQYDITRNELRILATYVGVNSFPPAIRMLESGVIKPSALITHQVPLAELPAAFDAARRGEAVKVVVETRLVA